MSSGDIYPYKRSNWTIPFFSFCLSIETCGTDYYGRCDWDEVHCTTSQSSRNRLGDDDLRGLLLVRRRGIGDRGFILTADFEAKCSSKQRYL